MKSEENETAERLSAIIESAVDGILAIDATGTLESVNQAAVELFGFARDELIGKMSTS